MANTLLVKRGTRAQLNAAAAASGLKAGEPYLITDEGRLAVGLSVSTYGEWLGTGDSPQFTAIELGAASDTTLARSAAGKMTIEGVEVTTTSNTQTLTNKTVTALKETKTTSSSYNFDLAAGNYFTHTASANSLTVSNVPATGTVASFIIELTNGGAYTFSFWVGSGGAPIKWAGGAVPALTASGVDILGFYTHDGGTTWRGLLLAKDSK